MRTRLLITWTLLAATLAALIITFQFGSQSAADPADAPPVDALPAAAIEPGGIAPVSTADTMPDTTPESVPPDIVPIDEPLGEPDIPPPAEPATPDQVVFAVDSALAPAQATVEPLDGTTETRPVARLRSTGGTESDIVLDELLVAFTDAAERDGFLERWNGVVLEADRDDANGITDYLVRIDPTTAQRDRLAADLVAVEPHHVGTMIASDDTAFSLMAIAAQETVEHGTEVALNWLDESDSVTTATTSEDPALSNPDAFAFDWISSTGAQASGIDAAWQLLDKAVGTRVKMMVVDRGFVYNEDFPVEAKLRHGEWGAADDWNCGGNPCPFHGTDVTMAAMGRADNGFGTAGPASYVADLIAVRKADTTRKSFKNIRELAEEERPHIINMSFGGEVTAFQGSAERKYGRWFRSIRDDLGALSFSSAGNSGIDVDNNDALTVPCEIPGVVCVGGMNGGDGMAAANSNFGTGTGGGSVEIYGPYCTYGLVNPDVPGDSTVKTVCGTSVASPVVAGVAALVKAANPTLGPKEIWQIMKDTAHTRNLGSHIGNGHHRSIDAYRAVATAKGAAYTLPQVTITGPSGTEEFGPNDFFDLTASATNFAGLDLPIQWFRGDGSLVNSTPTTDPVTVGELDPGTHVFRAWAWDVMGNGGHDTIEITVFNTPPEVSISSPAANTYRYTVEQVVLDGSTRDADLLWQSLSDDQVAWTVRSQNGGAVVFTVEGHSGKIPANSLPAGDYTVEFTGVDVAGTAISDIALLTMLDVPPGESLPSVVMISPVPGESHGVDSGTVPVHLQASATDTQDGVIDGTQMRWTAEQGDTRIVLCEGSDLAAGSNGGIAVITDCSDVTVQMSVPPEAPHNNRWTITVEAIDSAGLPGRVTRVVEIHASVG